MNAEQQPLAQFVDRDTMRYERRYPHPIERVFDAVSTAEHLEAWLLPVTRVERRVGGRCSFTWGAPEEDYLQAGEVTEFDPPRAVTYTFDEPEGSMRFALTPDGDGTVLHFTLHWPVPRGAQLDTEDYPGGDLPAGPDTAWRPGFLAGFHEFLDDLGPFLEGTWTGDDRLAAIASHPMPEDELVERYRVHVRTNCPPR